MVGDIMSANKSLEMAAPGYLQPGGDSAEARTHGFCTRCCTIGCDEQADEALLAQQSGVSAVFETVKDLTHRVG